MLFFTDAGYLEVLSEKAFENVFTLQASTPDALKLFEAHTPASIMVNRRSRYPYVLHVRKEKVAEVLDCVSVLFDTEVAQLPISARVPLYLVEGKDANSQEPVRYLLSAIEFDTYKSELEALVDTATFPIYKRLDEIMDEGGLK